MLIIVLHTRHRAAQAGSMLKVDHMHMHMHMHGPVAAVQQRLQSTMPGACQELGSITWPHTAHAPAREHCAALPVWLPVGSYSSAA